MQVAYFLNGPIFDLLFYCHINSYWEKVTSYEKFNNNLTPELQIFRKFQYFNAINWSIKMLKNGWISKKFKKIVKHFPPTHPLSDKIHPRLRNKSFLTVMYRNIQIFAFKLLQECSSGHQEMVQCKCFFWHQTERCLLEIL